MSVGSVTTEVLEPLVGRILADTYVRATATSLGKSVDQLGREDLPLIEERVRGLLAPVASSAVIESSLTKIRGAA